MKEKSHSITEIFKSTKRLLTILYIYSTTDKTKILNIAYSCLTLIVIISCLIGDFCFIVANFHSNFERSCNAAYSAMAAIPSLYSYIVILILRQNVVDIIQQFQDICDSSTVWTFFNRKSNFQSIQFSVFHHAHFFRSCWNETFYHCKIRQMRKS